MGGRDRGRRLTGRLRGAGCFPGSFGPLTVAHLAVAEAALATGLVDRVDLVLSVDALGRSAGALPSVEERAEVLRGVVGERGGLGVRVSEHRLVADLAAGYDAVVLGADKWRQVLDPAWYGDDPGARDRAVAGLPTVLVAPRADDDERALRSLSAAAVAGGPDVRVLSVDTSYRTVNASAIRSGEPGATAWVADDPAVRAAVARWFPPPT